jgi:hypothetical protein
MVTSQPDRFPDDPLEFAAQVAGYAAAAMSKAGRETNWPDTAQGNALKLVIGDIGEHSETLVAAARAGYWSVVGSLERLIFERIEVLMGSAASERYAKAYLDSIVEGMNERGTGPAKRARPEDAPFDAFLGTLTIPKEMAEEWRAANLLIKNLKSAYFVHPTAMGPLLSDGIRNRTIQAEAPWGEVLAYFVMAVTFSLTAAARLKCASPVELFRALDGTTKAAAKLSTFSFPEMRAIYEHIAAKARPLAAS